MYSVAVHVSIYITTSLGIVLPNPPSSIVKTSRTVKTKLGGLAKTRIIMQIMHAGPRKHNAPPAMCIQMKIILPAMTNASAAICLLIIQSASKVNMKVG